MQFVYNIYSTLDDATQFADFNNGTMRSFVYQLEQVKKALGHYELCKDITRPMIGYLRLACDHLNRAADEYEYHRRRTDTFYKKKNAALKELEKVLDVWELTQRSS